MPPSGLGLSVRKKRPKRIPFLRHPLYAMTSAAEATHRLTRALRGSSDTRHNGDTRRDDTQRWNVNVALICAVHSIRSRYTKIDETESVDTQP